MMRNRRFVHLALILAFMVGQWMAVVHATKHELVADGDSATCEVCAVAHSGGGLPAAVIVFIPFIFAQIFALGRPIGVVTHRAFLLPQGRAPPLLPR